MNLHMLFAVIGTLGIMAYAMWWEVKKKKEERNIGIIIFLAFIAFLLIEVREGVEILLIRR